MNVTEILAGDAHAARRWLDTATVPRDFNWHGLADGAAARARAANAVDDADAWADVAIRIYEQLATSGTGSFELSAMNLRAWMIARYGASEHRDVQKLVDWFRARTPMPLEHAHREATRLRALPIDRWSEQLALVQTLRGLKNRICVFRTLPDPPDEIRPWLAVWPLLP